MLFMGQYSPYPWARPLESVATGEVLDELRDKTRLLNPALVIGRESASRHDAMHVRMADQRLAPGVEDAEHADLRAEMARVRRDLPERGRAQLQEPRVQTGTVPIRQGQERMRQREDDVHIRHVEEIPLACGEPALAHLRLALRAVP